MGAPPLLTRPLARSMRLLLALVALGGLRHAHSQTLKLSSTLTIEKTDSKENTHEQVQGLLNHAREKKLGGNIVRFLENTVQQLQKVLDAAKVVEEKKLTEVPKDFTPQKYRVKAMPKLQAKKVTVKKIAAKDLRAKLREGKDINFDVPLLVKNATALFSEDDWRSVKRHWSASRIMEDENLERDLRIEYFPPDKARARLVGNQLHMEEPELVPFSRYIVVCFHGTPAKPKLPGQNTEHCEQTVDAMSMVKNSSELQELAIFPEIKNAMPLQAEFRRRLLDAGAAELPAILGKQSERWKKNRAGLQFRYFVFGPSGSGDKLHAENGLPFYDILIHGSRRWLLLTEEEMNRVAEKAKEALEFDKTSAYMFFEEKLPELREEFGLKKFVEANQEAGDLVIVPSGWFRVSLSLADSISYYETILSEKETLKAVTDNQVWRPQFRQYALAFCYEKDELIQLPGVDKGSQFHSWLKEAIFKVSDDELLPGIMAVLLQCGSTLALDKAMPELKVAGLTACTPSVWKRCRSRLKARLQAKGETATLAWLPEQAPRSLDDIVPSSSKVADEL